MISKLRQFKDVLIARLLLRYPALFQFWERNSEFPTFSDSPWTPLLKPVNQATVALVTTGGVHLRSQPAFDMENREGDASFREIPANTAPETLKITHNYYDHRDADKDVNVVLPLDRLKIMEEMGDIGKANHRHFSFMGHISHKQKDRLLDRSIPSLIQLLKADEIDIVILSPA